MKLARVGEPGAERPVAVLDDGRLVDLSPVTSDIDPDLLAGDGLAGYPGDLINTGTPAGVALGQPDPKPYLRAGDVVDLEIDGLGRQRQTLGAA